MFLAGWFSSATSCKTLGYDINCPRNCFCLFPIFQVSVKFWDSSSLGISSFILLDRGHPSLPWTLFGGNWLKCRARLNYKTKLQTCSVVCNSSHVTRMLMPFDQKLQGVFNVKQLICSTLMRRIKDILKQNWRSNPIIKRKTIATLLSNSNIH